MNQSFKFDPLEDIKLLAVLGHSNKSVKPEDPMTFDAIVRCRAAGNLYKDRKVRKIILVGGGNDRVKKVAEAERMRQYLNENFDVPDDAMDTQSEGTNTISDLTEIIRRVKFEELDDEQVVLLTSDYNTVRVKLVLEILGARRISVFASERILLESGDAYSAKAGKYLDSEDYQKRLSYEAYWMSKTIADSDYTKTARETLKIKKNPTEHFKDEPVREMENIDK